VTAVSKTAQPLSLRAGAPPRRQMPSNGAVANPVEGFRSLSYPTASYSSFN
jgi:hypothetical protein